MSDSTAFDALDVAAVNVRAAFNRVVDENTVFAADNRVKADLIAVQAARIAVLEGTVPPDPVPLPVVGFPTLGACPINGGGNLLTVESKWGDGPERAVVGRYFSGSRSTAIGTRPPVADMPCVILSTKPDSAYTDAELVSLGTTSLTQPLDLFCTWHEPDVKYKKLAGVAAESALAQWRDISSKKNAAIARLRAAGQIQFDSIDIFGGWIFTDNIDDSKFVPDVKATYVGIDIDGTTGGSSYYNWADPVLLARINAFVAKHGYKGWFATEYAWGATVGDRATGFPGRIAAIRAQVPKILAAGCMSIVVYDYDNNPDEALRTAPEIAAMKAAVPV